MPPFDAVIEAPFGRVGLHLAGDALVHVDLWTDASPVSPRGAAAHSVVAALRRYFEDPTAQMDLPISFSATPFRERVWRALREIPAGRVETYGALAQRLGTGARAIGGACRENPLPLVIPCHRVVATNGLGGFAGERKGVRTGVKAWLLRHEAARPDD